MRHKPHFCRQGIFSKWWIKADYKQKISQKWGEKPHFRLIFGRPHASISEPLSVAFISENRTILLVLG